MQTATVTRTQVPAAPIDDVEELLTKFPLQYTWNYAMVREELTNLYEKAKRDQWNATDQLAWSTSVDPESELVPDFQIPIYGTHIWQKLTPAEIRKTRREALSWTLSQFMHGEQGALLATAQIVTATPSIESKFYASTQVMDEARHVEVYSRYLREKLTRQYPVNAHLKTLLDQILTDSRWDMKYLGMQILVEGLAMAAFGFIHKMCNEPLLKDLTHYVMRDESRHVAFGVLSLNDYFMDMSAPELRVREEFLAEGCRLMRDRLLMEDVWQEMGWPVDEVREIVLHSPQMQEFRKLLFSKVVPNVKRLGLLTPFVRERFEELGILQFENEEPSA
jgi:para-aminobenzoate N-oxygenase AurF